MLSSDIEYTKFSGVTLPKIDLSRGKKTFVKII